MQKVVLKGFKVIRKLTGREQDFSNAIKGFMWVWIKLVYQKCVKC